MQLGILYGVSVGPGDPQLMTLAALRLLQTAPVVAFPAGVNGKPGMAEQIVFPWLSCQQKKLPLQFPYARDEEVLQKAWEEAARQVWQHLKQGREVVFACEGDVSFYSTFTYLSRTLLALHPEAIVRTVPGVCSPMAAAAVLGIPLTIGSQTLAILPTLYKIAELETALDWADVVVLMKFNSVYERVWQVLSDRGLLERASIVERATFSDRVIYDNLIDRPCLQLSYFSILIARVNV